MPQEFGAEPPSLWNRWKEQQNLALRAAVLAGAHLFGTQLGTYRTPPVTRATTRIRPRRAERQETCLHPAPGNRADAHEPQGSQGQAPRPPAPHTAHPVDGAPVAKDPRNQGLARRHADAHADGSPLAHLHTTECRLAPPRPRPPCCVCTCMTLIPAPPRPPPPRRRR
jgi:hypothetical protein